MRQLKGNGAGIIFITHHLEEVKEVADRVTVMRDGEVVDTTLMADTSIKEIIAKMAGQEVIFSKFEREFQEEEVVLRAERLTHKKKFRDVSFEVKKGEIFGVGGLVGAGRTGGYAGPVRRRAARVWHDHTEGKTHYGQIAKKRD